jgi:uncharacterized protein with HEPN domain
VPPTVADRLRHILHSIEEIQGLLADASQQEFADNRLLCLAVERLLEIVCEASRHIPAEAKERTPEIPWRPSVETRVPSDQLRSPLVHCEG